MPMLKRNTAVAAAIARISAGRQLLRLRSPQQHAIVQRMQESALGNPVLFLDQDAVQNRDPLRRAAEAQQCYPQPDPKGFREADAATGTGFGGRLVRSDVDHGFALLVGHS